MLAKEPSCTEALRAEKEEVEEATVKEAAPSNKTAEATVAVS